MNKIYEEIYRNLIKKFPRKYLDHLHDSFIQAVKRKITNEGWIIMSAWRRVKKINRSVKRRRRRELAYHKKNK